MSIQTRSRSWQRIALRLVLSISTLAAAASQAAPLNAQSENSDTIEFDATFGTPTTTVQIDGETVTFALDPLLGPFLTINPAASQRMDFRSVKEGAISAKIDGARIKGSLAKVELTAARRTHTVEAALINRDHLSEAQSAQYDVAGGFEALPADYVVVHLNRDLTGPMQEIEFSRRRSDKRAGFPVGIGSAAMRINIQFANPATWMDRSAAEPLIDRGLVIPTGEVEELPVWYGLRMSVQPLQSTTPITIKGIKLDRLQARTSEPLILPEPDENVIIVKASRPGRRAPSILLGLDTLKQCAKVVFDRQWRRLTFTCPK